MARLHEFQGKALLREAGVMVPEGRAVQTPEEAAAAVEALGGKAIMKVQAWTTSRKAQGGVVIVEGAQQARDEAQRLLSMTFGNFPVTFVLVEQLLDIAQECFVSLTIDDAARRPLLLFDPTGGSGIEDRAESVAQIGVDLSTGVDETALRAACQGLPTESIDGVVAAIGKIVALAQEIEARSFEVNPLVVLADGSVAAADCRVTIDDYAVFRHPELGIEIARELDHPATALEHVAYAIEQADHRGTFYFAQLPTDGSAESAGVIGFHGAGGGGSMMSMDAAVNEGFTLANFCDTSGNPSAAKVLPRSSGHSLPARPCRVLRIWLWRCQPGAVSLRLWLGEGVQRIDVVDSDGNSTWWQQRGSGCRDPGRCVPRSSGNRGGVSQGRYASEMRIAICRTRKRIARDQ